MAASRALLLALALAAPGCGEDVNFTSGQTDGGASDGSLTPSATPGPSDATPRNRPVAFGPDRDDGGCSLGFDASPDFCKQNGSICHSTRECCSSRCEQGYCLPGNACSAPGAPCNTRTNCCSGRCEPSEPSGPRGNLFCSQYCQADGTSCDNPNECCSLGCNGGQCGGPLCVTAGGPCVDDSQCCSAKCIGGACFLAPSACLATGEGCGLDAGALPCCTGFCNHGTGRCDLGGSLCREPSSPCDVDSDCCMGRCLRNTQGVYVCTAPCLAEGEACYSNGDCCNPLVCSGYPQRCEPLPPRCP